MQTLTERDYKKIFICLTLYITSLFAANTLGIKLMPFLFGTHLTVAVFSFPTVFFMLIAFAAFPPLNIPGVYPLATIVAIIIPWWLYKVLMGFLYTPLSYLGIYLLKGKNANNSNQN